MDGFHLFPEVGVFRGRWRTHVSKDHIAGVTLMILIEAREWIYVIQNRNYALMRFRVPRSSTAIYKRERILLIIRIFV